MSSWLTLGALLAAALGPATAFGAAELPERETRVLTLSEAVGVAARQSPTFLRSREELRIAEARVLEAAGLDDLVLEANASANHDRTEAFPGQTPPSDQLHFDAALFRPLPTGGRLGLRYRTDVTRFPLATSDADRLYTPSLTLSFSHPLLRGAGVRIARADQRRAAVGRYVAALTSEAALARLLRDVSQAYFSLAEAAAALEIHRASLALAREQSRVVDANIAVGKQPPTASAEVEVAVALRQEDVLLAEQAWRAQARELHRLLGVPVGSGAPLFSAVGLPEVPIEEPDASTAVRRALQRNPELLAARAGSRAAAVDVDVAANGRFPQLDLSIDAGPIGNAGSAQVAFAQLGKWQGSVVQATLALSEPLGHRAARGRAEAADAALRRAQLTEQELAGQIQTSVENAVDLVRTALGRVRALSQVAQLATLDLRAERARFAVGRASNFDVLRRQEEVARAQLQQAHARTDYLSSRAALEALTTEILTRYAKELR
jgi:outer membrane protein TolC